MPSLNLYIDKRSKSPLKKIFGVVTHEGKQFPIRPGWSVPEENWDNRRKTVKGSSETINAIRDGINTLSEIIEIKIPKEFEAVGIHYPTIEQIRQSYEQNYRHLVGAGSSKKDLSDARRPSRASIPVSQHDFIDYCREYYEIKLGKMSEPGLRRYLIVAKDLDLFRKHSGASTKICDIDKIFWERFSSFLLNTEITDEAGAVVKATNIDSTLVGKLKKINSVIQFFDLPLKGVRIKGIVSGASEKHDEGFKHLEVAEIMDVWSFNDFGDEHHLEQYRDAFVFNCFTGPRHNELIALKASDVIDVLNPDGPGTIKTLRYKVSKQHGNAKTVEVPLNSICLDIVEKYAKLRNTNPWVNEWTDTTTKEQKVNTDPLLVVHSNQKMNVYLKRLLFLVGLNQMSNHYGKKIDEANYKSYKPIGLLSPEEISIKKGNRSETILVPKYTTITCHSGRHSFACHLIDSGIDLYKVSKFLGHSTVSPTEKYYAKMRRNKLLSGVADKLEVAQKPFFGDVQSGRSQLT